jgi:hypothetical protein
MAILTHAAAACVRWTDFMGHSLACEESAGGLRFSVSLYVTGGVLSFRFAIGMDGNMGRLFIFSNAC